MVDENVAEQDVVDDNAPKQAVMVEEDAPIQAVMVDEEPTTSSYSSSGDDEDELCVNESEQTAELYKVGELRPLVWSKTITLFDVYETDEENFEPYISPLATIGGGSSQSSETGDGDSSETQETGSEGESQLYSQISVILQKYYDKPTEGWNNLTNSVRLAKTGNEIGNILAKQKKKKGQEGKSYVDVSHEIQKIRGMGY